MATQTLELCIVKLKRFWFRPLRFQVRLTELRGAKLDLAHLLL